MASKYCSTRCSESVPAVCWETDTVGKEHVDPGVRLSSDKSPMKYGIRSIALITVGECGRHHHRSFGLSDAVRRPCVWLPQPGSVQSTGCLSAWFLRMRDCSLGDS